VWLVAVVVAATWAFGLAGFAIAVASAALAFAALPLVARVREDFQAIRGWLHRRDPEVVALAADRERLLAAFPELRDA
jgi:hypothetical protein